MKTAVYYTCGSSRNVRGNCGHKHRTLEGAVECNRRDQAGCASQGGYSDRAIRVIEDGTERELTDGEFAAADHAYYR